jgi:hypothetical protein
MKTTGLALALGGAVLAIAGCTHLCSEGGKQADTRYLILEHQGLPPNPHQSEHGYRDIHWSLKESGKPVPHAEYWNPGDGLTWMSIPNLGTWPAVATTNGRVRLQFTPKADTKAGHFNYRIAIAPESEIYAMVAPQSNYCDVDILEETVVFGGGFTNQMRGANERIQTR